LGRLWHRKDIFLNFRSEIKETEDLGDPSSGEAFLAGDFGLGGNLTGLKEPLPLDGLSEKFDHSWRLGLSRGPWRAPWRRNGTYNLSFGHPAAQGT